MNNDPPSGGCRNDRQFNCARALQICASWAQKWQIPAVFTKKRKFRICASWTISRETVALLGKNTANIIVFAIPLWANLEKHLRFLEKTAGMWSIPLRFLGNSTAIRAIFGAGARPSANEVLPPGRRVKRLKLRWKSVTVRRSRECQWLRQSKSARRFSGYFTLIGRNQEEIDHGRHRRNGKKKRCQPGQLRFFGVFRGSNSQVTAEGIHDVLRKSQFTAQQGSEFVLTTSLLIIVEGASDANRTLPDRRRPDLFDSEVF